MFAQCQGPCYVCCVGLPRRPFRLGRICNHLTPIGSVVSSILCAASLRSIDLATPASVSLGCASATRILSATRSWQLPSDCVKWMCSSTLHCADDCLRLSVVARLAIGQSDAVSYSDLAALAEVCQLDALSPWARHGPQTGALHRCVDDCRGRSCEVMSSHIAGGPH